MTTRATARLGNRARPASPSRRATPEQRRVVEQVLHQHAAQFERLTLAEQRAFLPMIVQAERELAEQFQQWTEQALDNTRRWTAHTYRVALAQLQADAISLAQKLEAHTDAATLKGQALGLKHLVREVARFSLVFEGSGRPLAMPVAHLIATGRAFIVPRVRTSAARYAGKVGEDLRTRVAVDMLKGASISETVDRLVKDGGPRGQVALQGVAGEPGAVVEHIAEGLFTRYRGWAMRVVRTETASAYNAQILVGAREAVNTIPGLQKRWCAEGKACAAICAPMDGVTVELYENFQLPNGAVEAAPGHPNCVCRSGVWRSNWATLRASLGI